MGSSMGESSGAPGVSKGRSEWGEALRDDPEIGVVVLSTEGIVESATAPAARLLLGDSPERMIGAPLARLFGDEAGRECREILSRVISGNKPVIVEGVWQGVHARCVLRALVGHEGGGVLAVVRRAPCRLRREDTELEVVTLRHADWGPLGSLSNRERQVLGLIGMGMTAAQISRKFGRSVKTIDAHRRSIGKKLRLRNRVELARVAILAGLSPLPHSASRR
jgi:DNA-binding CsgD family transcriptional regulator